MIKTGQTGVAADWIIPTTAGEALSARDACYISTSDGKAYKCDADDLTKMDFIGFAQEAASLNAAVNIVTNTMATGFSGLTIGGVYYVSGTAGAITTTAPTNKTIVGVAVSATTIRIERPSKRVVIFTASGTWTKYPGLKYIEVEQIGAGGGSEASTASNGNYGIPGASAGYGRKTIQAASLGATETVTVGVGGSAGTGSGGDGTAGGNTSFGSHMTTNGGGAGSTATPPSGGTVTGADFSIDGKSPGDGSSPVSATGCDSMLGFGGKVVSNGSAAGNGYGSSGSAGYCASGSTARNGAAGRDGIVIVTEYYG